MCNKLVTVVIPVFNVEKYLSICLDSVISQTYKELEIIIVNDGSTDGCAQICNEYEKKDNRISVIHQTNGGQGKARNVALNSCRGDYIAFLDSDDCWDKKHIETLMNIIRRNDADIAICSYNHVDEYGNILGGAPRSTIKEKKYSGVEAMEVALYWNEFGVAPWAKLYKKSVWNNVRFKEDRIYEDLGTTYLVYFNAKSVVYINERLMSYRIRKNSDIHQSFNIRKARIMDSADEIMDFCMNSSPRSIRAAESRELASASFIYFRIPNDELERYKQVEERCRYIIKKYRINVMFDAKARKKTRLGALCTFFGFKTARIIFNIFFGD